MNENKIFQSPRASRTKRLTIGAASVLAAGALLGAGVQGASATPLTPAPGHTASSSASAESTSGDAFLASIQKELRGDLSHGKSVNEKAQKVAATLVDHAELFASLPPNLQADLTTLKDASAADRAAAVQTIQTTALDGGYGEQIAKVALAVKNDPTHPLAAARHSALGEDTATGTDTAPSVTKLALGVVDNPALFSKLPAELQSALTDLKNAPAAEQDAAAQAIEKAALNGDYGHDIQKIVERIQAGAKSHSQGKNEAGADTHSDTKPGSTDTGAHAKAGN